MQFYLGGLLLAAVAGVVAALIEDTGLGVAVGVGILVVVLVIGWIKRLSTNYLVTTERLHIRKGIVARNVQETRLERVQNVNTSQSVIQRILQIGTVDFDTAGTDDYQFQFVGVGQPEHVVAAVDRAARAASQGPSAPPAAPSATAE